MNQIALLIATALLAFPLMAERVDSVDIVDVDATSLTLSSDRFVDRIFASGPFVQLLGGQIDVQPAIPVNQDGTIALGFPAFTGVTATAFVSAPGYLLLSSDDVSGFVDLTPESFGPVLAPPTGATYTFPGRAHARFGFTNFTDVPSCGPPPELPCAIIAQISIDVPGVLTVRLSPIDLGIYDWSLKFVSSPEPTTFGMGFLGAILTLTLYRWQRRKRGNRIKENSPISLLRDRDRISRKPPHKGGFIETQSPTHFAPALSSSWK